MLTTKRAVIAAAAIIAASLGAGLLYWNALPYEMAVHWSSEGYADGFATRTFGVFFLPLLAAGMASLLFALPKIDPLASGFKAFRKEYDGLILLMVGFFALLHGASLAWNLGARFEFLQIIGPGIGLLFFYIGAIMPQMRRNWFAGIRTPWTLSSDKVWEETHRVGGKLFKLSGVLAILGAVFTEYALLFMIVPILATTLGVTIYSYLVYRKGA